MSEYFRSRTKLVLMLIGLLGTLICGVRAVAADFGLSVTGAPSAVQINQPVTYNIAVSNQTGFPLTVVFLTNEFSAPVRYVAATNNVPVTLATNSNTVVFQYSPFSGSQTDLVTLVISPTTFGDLTNTVTVASFARTNTTTNVVIKVVAGQPDLGIAIAGPAQAVLMNDWVTYTLTASNQGADATADVIVSNNIPADFKLLSVTPSNQVATVNNVLRWTISSLASGGSDQLNVTVQPTNSGVATVSASISAANVLDTNTVNDAAATNINVGPLVAGALVASNFTAMTFNPQTGLMNQTVRLVNVSTNAVDSARIIVTGLTNRLYNAVGTNDGNPFAVYAARLETNAPPVDLVFEYFVPTRLPIVVADSQLHAFGAPSANLAPPAGTPFLITTNLLSALGDFIIEFRTTPGRSYTVLYSDNSSFTNALAAQPPIVAPADRVQWIDDGPPKTVSRPASAGSRFYRVIQNP